MEATRDFKGIWIPKEIWLNDELTLLEKVFLVEINSLDNEDGCFASNDHFARFFGISKPRCTQVIKSLKEKGILNISYTYRPGSKEIEKRTLMVGSKFSYGGDKFIKGGDKFSIIGDKKISKIIIHSNNTVNNTSKENKGGKPLSDEEKEINNLFFNAVKDIWFNHHPEWQFSGKDGAGIKSIIKQLNGWQNIAGKEVTPETTALAFNFILSHQAVKGNGFLSTACPLPYPVS